MRKESAAVAVAVSRPPQSSVGKRRLVRNLRTLVDQSVGIRSNWRVVDVPGLREPLERVDRQAVVHRAVLWSIAEMQSLSAPRSVYQVAVRALPRDWEGFSGRPRWTRTPPARQPPLGDAGLPRTLAHHPRTGSPLIKSLRVVRTAEPGAAWPLPVPKSQEKQKRRTQSLM